MKRILAILIAMLSLCGCLNEKDYAENAIDPSLIVGSWYESYEIYPYLAWDGGATYTFYEDESYLLEAYDVEAGHSSYTYNYTISDGVITTTTTYGSTSYKIVRLDKSIMEWQKVGTEFSEGTLFTDYKRFKRKK
ncbi:MAG: hypothetical protein IKW27_09255 [Bacteroidales bacterium]|nr:hypothetical protein [Bacteroidales bacterium]